MAGTLENSLDDLFGEGGLFADEALAGEKQLAPTGAAPEEWIEPDAVALSPDDPSVTPASPAASAALQDPSEVALDPADSAPLELDDS